MANLQIILLKLSKGDFKQENYKETIYLNHGFLLASRLRLGNEIYGRNSHEIFYKKIVCFLLIISVTGTICFNSKNKKLCHNLFMCYQINTTDRQNDNELKYF